MTPTNAEFNWQFNDIPLKIEIGPKIGGKKQTKKIFARENLS